MENINTAKRELYQSLKSNLNEVTGAGIRERDGYEYIVIFISKMNDAVMNAIPRQWKGNIVETEIKQVAKAYSS